MGTPRRGVSWGSRAAQVPVTPPPPCPGQSSHLARRRRAAPSCSARPLSSGRHSGRGRRRWSGRSRRGVSPEPSPGPWAEQRDREGVWSAVTPGTVPGGAAGERAGRGAGGEATATVCWAVSSALAIGPPSRTHPVSGRKVSHARGGRRGAGHEGRVPGPPAGPWGWPGLRPLRRAHPASPVGGRGFRQAVQVVQVVVCGEELAAGGADGGRTEGPASHAWGRRGCLRGASASRQVPPPSQGTLRPCGTPHYSLHVSKDRNEADAGGCPLQTPDSRPKHLPLITARLSMSIRLSPKGPPSEGPPSRMHGGGTAVEGGVSLT